MSGKIYFDGTTLCTNRSGELYSATGMLTVLREYFKVVIFFPSDCASMACDLRDKYDLTDKDIVFLPIRRRAILLVKLMGLGLPQLKPSDDDLVVIPTNNIVPRVGRQLCVCHDLRAITEPRYWKLKERLHMRLHTWMIKHSGCGIICHSLHVRKELLRVTKVNPSRVIVVPLSITGTHPMFSRNNGSKAVDERKELLYISNYHKIKNFEVIIKYIRQLNRETGLGLRLTIAGNGVCTRGHLSYENDHEVKVFDYISNYDREQLYMSADIYINPAASEGFGITNLEAQSYGLPVLCNDIPAFREVLGASAAYFNAESYVSFRRSLLQIVEDPIYADCLIQSSYQSICRPSYLDNLRQELVPWLILNYPALKTRDAIE